MTGKVLCGAQGDEKPCTCLVVGAGIRGSGYAVYAQLFPEQLKIVGVAEPSDVRRESMVKQHGVDPKYTFTDWREAARVEKFADFVMICTVDQDHKDPAVTFAKLGYHILLEKPMAVTEADCREIVQVCSQNSVQLAVGLVSRYTAWVNKIKEIIDAGEIGDVVSVRLTVPIGFHHYAHSYVRGDWRNEGSSSFALMSTCHDIDVISHWMAPQRCVQVSSSGTLSHFTSKEKPEGAAARCLDCPVEVEEKCAYSAKKLYLDLVKKGETDWPVNALSDVVDVENITEALKSGPYGKCVYDLDSDVVSQQVVNFQFENGATAELNTAESTKPMCTREVKIKGTKGEIAFEEGWSHIRVFDFLMQRTVYYNFNFDHPAAVVRHGDTELHLMKTFINSLKGQQELPTRAEETLNSHLLVFAVEKARKENCVVTINPDGTF